MTALQIICLIGILISMIVFVYGLVSEKEGYAVYSIPVAIILIVTEFSNWVVGLVVSYPIIFLTQKIYDKSIHKKYNQQNNSVSNGNTKTNITPLVYNESLKGFMDMFREMAEELGKVDNFEKYCHRLKEKVELLQGYYGYALQNLENRGKILSALAFYYLFNVDGLVWIYTRRETTDEQFADILQLIVDASDDEDLNDNIDFVMKNIVDGYFMWRQEEIPLDDYDYQKPIKKEILPSLDWNKEDK